MGSGPSSATRPFGTLEPFVVDPESAGSGTRGPAGHGYGKISNKITDKFFDQIKLVASEQRSLAQHIHTQFSASLAFSPGLAS